MSPYELVAAFIVVPMAIAFARIFERFFAPYGVRVPSFEAWVHRERPVVIALRARRGRGREVAFEVRAALGDHEVFNHQGAYPWTGYRFTLDVEQIEGRDVVIVRAIECALRRGRQQRPELGAQVARMFRACDGWLDEAWLHGELHGGGGIARADRARFGWHADLGEGGAIALAPMIGAPTWMRAA